jgi:hypothetical protein
MINRYDKPLQVIQLSDGRSVLATARPTAITPKAGDIAITAGEQDRFDIIANNVYGHASDWWRIAAANGQVNGSLTVPIGSNIIIPQK